MTPPLSPQTKLNFEQNGWKWVLFLAQHCWVRGGGARGQHEEPKAHQKNVMKSRVLHNNYLEWLFHTVPSSLVLHCGPPPVYQDLSWRNDWHVKKSHCWAASQDERKSEMHFRKFTESIGGPEQGSPPSFADVINWG